MGLIAEITAALRPRKRGNGHDKLSPASVEAALERLHFERAEATAAIAGSTDRRRELLRRDDSDDALDALERETDAHHRTLERLELLEGDLLRQLDDLRDAGRAAEWASRREAIEVAAAHYIGAARAACGALERFQAAIGAARSAGFEHEVTPYFGGGVPTVLAAAAFDRYEAIVERVRLSPVVLRSLRRPVSVAPRPVIDPRAPPPSVGQVGQGRVVAVPLWDVSAPMPHGDFVRPHAAPAAPEEPPPPLGNAGRGHAVRLDTLPPPPPSRPPRDAPPPGEGEIQCVAVRPGVELPDGTPAALGDRFNLPSDQARRLAEGGAVDFVQGGEK